MQSQLTKYIFNIVFLAKTIEKKLKTSLMMN